jgi:hypothetical protein
MNASGSWQAATAAIPYALGPRLRDDEGELGPRFRGDDEEALGSRFRGNDD